MLSTDSTSQADIDMNTSPDNFVSALKYLGDITSRNLEFSYQSKAVSYGEVTITESNLLELRRISMGMVRLHTFSNHEESKNGADWEWKIIGRERTLNMLVQAKRVQSNGVLKIRHTVAGSGREQREILIETARARRMRPVYCIYCTEDRRSHWKRRADQLQTGCLLADARCVPVDTRKLRAIEKCCWPWHYLFKASREPLDETKFAEQLQLHAYCVCNTPSIRDLNEDTERQYDSTGVERTTACDLEMINGGDGAEPREVRTCESWKWQNEKNLQRRVVAIDVRSLEY